MSVLTTLLFSFCIWSDECYTTKVSEWITDSVEHSELALLECNDHSKYLLEQHNAIEAYCLVEKLSD